INNFEEIVTNTEVLNQLIENLTNTTVGGNVSYDGDQFTYIDENNVQQVINFEEIVQANETVTTLVNNNDGTYTYTNEAGATVTIDVPADVINNFEEIVTNTEVLNQLIENLTNTTVGGNVSYDGDQFTYIDENNVQQVINFEEIVQANETVTTLVNNNDGTYTYTNEAGARVTIDVPADVINNFEEIVTNTEVLNQLIENLTNTTVGGNVSYDGDQFTYVDENNVVQNISFEEIVQANETVTTLVNNNDGTYTYTNEAGATVTIDVPADVINNFEEIVTNTEVLNQLIENLTNTTVGGNVSYDGDQFTYIDENNVQQVINFEEIVQANETVTTLVNNNDGTYTYTNEAGARVTIDVPADVINNFEEIVTNTEVLNQLIENLTNTTVGGNVSYDGDQFTYVDENNVVQNISFEEIVQANETVTTLVNNNDGTYTYTNEAGATVTIDVPADVINNFEEIVTNTEVLNQLIENLTNTTVGGNVSYDGDQFTYIDENNVVQNITLTDKTTADNGLTKVGDHIKLGGELTEATLITTDATRTLAIAGLEAGKIEDKLVVRDAQGILKQLKAAMPKYFYAPSVMLPTHNSSGDILSGSVEINLYDNYYKKQFGVEGITVGLVGTTTTSYSVSGATTNYTHGQARSNANATLPVLPVNELDYFITYYDTDVFDNVQISPTGILTYTVKLGAIVSAKTFMNIVFAVKD
ncbi:autotransporter outer membrane beta-barrel domain-containing protein, partial [Sphingobacterium olei]|uniref:hypothetical protein n=1 Tax=Sphingobacterium olei TaxID=2571155 RepID=UPI00139062C7